MRFPTNNARDILKIFRNSLNGKYDSNEIDSFFYLSMEKLTQKTRSYILAHRDFKVSESVINGMVMIIGQLEQNVPIQYILGETEFHELVLKTDKRALIPRPETEELVSILLNDYRSYPEPIKILDAGTGSGCIAIAVKKFLPLAEIIAIDISNEAISLANENALKCGISVDFKQIDILDAAQMATLPAFDAIISNPPYVREFEKNEMLANVLDYEPHNALFVADDDPLIFYRHLLQFAENKLNKGGRVYFEINEKLGKELLNQVLHNNYSAELLNDYHGRPRFCIIKKPE